MNAEQSETLKPFYELTGIETTKEDWEKEGYRVINFSKVKEEYMKKIDNLELALRFSSYCPHFNNSDEEMKPIYEYFERIVFKESRGNQYSRAIGWENINSFLCYHSGIFYRWFSSN